MSSREMEFYWIFTIMLLSTLRTIEIKCLNFKTFSFLMNKSDDSSKDICRLFVVLLLLLFFSHVSLLDCNACRLSAALSRLSR